MQRYETLFRRTIRLSPNTYLIIVIFLFSNPSVSLCLRDLCSKIIPSFFTITEGSTFLTKPLFPQEREDITTLQCYKCPTCPSPTGGSLILNQAFPLTIKGKDVAGSAIAPPEFWYRQRSLCPQGAADECLRNRVAIICRLAHLQDSINLPLSRKRFLKPCITLSAHS